ncbi:MULTISPECIES: STAS domain-containing protein [unclassified Amycolatopsis]|uniref:STAS domain-containing protein n=1 Tax=unclassified Amycolatopsis TaxID=2618356 RepID=UPI002E21ACC4|nr:MULTISPECIES: STAS domain-containing protein [unclassified Amycolatopsis]
MNTVAEPQDESVPPGAATPAPAAEVFTLPAPAELADAETAERTFAPALTVPPGTAVVLDLSAVTFLTVEAVVPLLELVERCAADGRVLRIVASPTVRRKLLFLGLDAVVPSQPPD